MKFLFATGEQVTLPIGSKLVGIQRNGRRPHSVVLGRRELLYFKRNFSYMRMIEQALEIDKEEMERSYAERERQDAYKQRQAPAERLKKVA